MNNMVFCRGCAAQIHETAATCPKCGAPQQGAAAQAASVSVPTAALSPADSLDKKLHLVLLVAAALGVILIFTTYAIPLIGLASGVCCGLSVRLFLAHKKTGFPGSTQLNWMLVMGAAALSFIVMLAGFYTIQAMFLIFVGVRGLIMYFTIYNRTAVIEPAKPE